MDHFIATLFDPMFQAPWLAGACLSVVLPLIGLYLRLRNEWLAALGLAQMSAATGLIGYGFGIPIFIAGSIGGSITALLKNFSAANNTAYALMILAGWAITFLVAANTALGESLGHTLIDGQLYFINDYLAYTCVALLVVGITLIRLIKKQLLRAQLFPHFEKLNETHTLRWHLSFDLLVAVSMAVATASIGLMTAFAMVFIPPWLAFRIAPSWKAAGWIAVTFNLAVYMAGFVFAILFDQPYGPTQVALHLLASAAVLMVFQLRLKQ
ncbi:MAG: ABC transporter [Gammaproteobacteria bacterium]|nr:MAG: ABC transporter [Gammaproteobacteria bacterium]